MNDGPVTYWIDPTAAHGYTHPYFTPPDPPRTDLPPYWFCMVLRCSMRFKKKNTGAVGTYWNGPMRNYFSGDPLWVIRWDDGTMGIHKSSELEKA